MGSIRILNPYQSPGIFRKAQLHLHTSQSLDVWRKIPVEQTVRRYKNAGYQFIVITDHDRLTRFTALDDSGFVTIPGVEDTIVTSFWPFGKHLIRIETSNSLLGQNFPKQKQIIQYEIIIPAHPNWPGNFGTGRWKISDLSQIANLRFIEIYNRHSPTPQDILLWHQLLMEHGSKRPVWGIAVDDTDNGAPLDLGWIMIKTHEVSEKAFFDALFQGAFYATCGPEADFKVEEETIYALTAQESQVIFFNHTNQIVAQKCGKMAFYHSKASDRFIRIEIINQQNKSAWSQPFYIVPNNVQKRTMDR